jgi:hypothetical protein
LPKINDGDGIIEDIYNIDGTYYLDKSQFIPSDKGSPNKI